MSKAAVPLITGDLVLDEWVIVENFRESVEQKHTVSCGRYGAFQQLGGIGNVIVNTSAILRNRPELAPIAWLNLPRRNADFLIGLLNRPLMLNMASHLAVLDTATVPLKRRFIDRQGTILTKIDEREEGTSAIEGPLLDMVPPLACVAIGDHNRGSVSTDLIMRARLLAEKHRVPFVVDPGNHLNKAHIGVGPYLSDQTIFKVNQSQWSRMSVGSSSWLAAVVTRGAAGLSVIFPDGKTVEVPLSATLNRGRAPTQAASVVGCGDAVLAGLAAYFTLKPGAAVNVLAAAHFAQAAAMSAVTRPGTVVAYDFLTQEALRDAENIQ